jgi:hypothetical protein
MVATKAMIGTPCERQASKSCGPHHGASRPRSGCGSVLPEILVARRIEQVEGEPSCSKRITAEETEVPRSRSIAIQSERTRRRSPGALTSPANWIAPPNSSNFSVKVGLPASGCEMIAKVRPRRSRRSGCSSICFS